MSSWMAAQMAVWWRRSTLRPVTSSCWVKNPCWRDTEELSMCWMRDRIAYRGCAAQHMQLKHCRLKKVSTWANFAEASWPPFWATTWKVAMQKLECVPSPWQQLWMQRMCTTKETQIHHPMGHRNHWHLPLPGWGLSWENLWWLWSGQGPTTCGPMLERKKWIFRTWDAFCLLVPGPSPTTRRLWSKFQKHAVASPWRVPQQALIFLVSDWVVIIRCFRIWWVWLSRRVGTSKEV